ncbi:MAG: DUF3168 domain-containing protein [Actinomycetota bacterium]
MDPVRDALYDRLKADATLMALTADGDVYHQRAPQNAQFPLIVFQRLSAVDEYTFKLTGRMLNALWLAKGIARGDSATPAEQLAARIDVVLADASLTITGHDLMWLRRESTVDYLEPDGAESFHHCGGLYRLRTSAA